MTDPRLRVVLTFQSLLVGGNPFATTSVYCLIAFLERRWGVHFPIGGTGALVRGLVSLIDGQGGLVRCGAGVAQITVEHGRATGVRLENGERVDADVVVSNADSAWTYRHLVAPEHRKRWTDRRIEKARYSMSLFVWYFGTTKRFDDVAHHTIVLGPRYRELLGDIFDRKVLADDFSLYLHRPTATDPSLAPDGCDAFYVLSPVPHLESGTDWSTVAEPYRRMVQARLEETLLPGLGDCIATSRLLTPQDFQDTLSSFRGAASGSSRCSRRARGSGRTTAARTSTASTSSAPARTRAPACRACSRRRASSTASCPMPANSPPPVPDSPVSPSPAADLDACRALLVGGSRTFLAASYLLPRAVRDAACALYAWCRVADDAIDGVPGATSAERAPATGAALERLRNRLDAIYAGEPGADAVERAFAAVVRGHAIPRALPEALLDGFAWDAQGRRYESLADLRAYAARVAGSVGAMMSLVMGARSADALARACDLGVAMQLSNIARDVGEDARAGRVYLPLAWLREEGVDVAALVGTPRFDAALGRVVVRLVAEAEALYARAGDGVALLPAACRVGIESARSLYGEIGREVGRRGGNSVDARAVVSPSRKAALLSKAVIARHRLRAAREQPPPLPETRHLVDAGSASRLRVATPPPAAGRVVWLIDLFERLERADRRPPAGAGLMR